MPQLPAVMLAQSAGHRLRIIPHVEIGIEIHRPVVYDLRTLRIQPSVHPSILRIINTGSALPQSLTEKGIRFTGGRKKLGQIPPQEGIIRVRIGHRNRTSDLNPLVTVKHNPTPRHVNGRRPKYPLLKSAEKHLLTSPTITPSSLTMPSTGAGKNVGHDKTYVAPIRSCSLVGTSGTELVDPNWVSNFFREATCKIRRRDTRGLLRLTRRRKYVRRRKRSLDRRERRRR